MAAVNLKVRGGNRMRAYLAGLEAAVGGASGVRVGFLEHSTYPSTPSESGLHVAQVAFYNEFGTSRAPARPFFRNMIKAQLGDWGAKLKKYLRGADFDTDIAFGLLGTDIKDALVDSIRRWPADNAPSTVRRKGFNHGLIDRGVMLRATEYEVLNR
jgi:hypothetical protein